MPEQIRCPSCDAALRLPESLLGSSVKCPKCRSTFTAELPPPQSIRTTPIREEERQQHIPLMETEDAGEEYDEDYPRRRRRRRGRRREEATNALMAPAVGLMVVAILGILVVILDLVFRMVGLSFSRSLGGSSSFTPAYRGGVVFGCGGDMVSALLYVFIIVGSVNMMKLRDHRSAMTACIIALLPCNPCCLFGYPFAIWGLVVLNRPDIKDAFS